MTPTTGTSGDLALRIDEVLAEQARLTAVERFAQVHDEIAPTENGATYEAPLPLARTLVPGRQLAFRVDLDECTGCKACVTACHSLNGLAPEETWRDVGLLIGDGVQQTVTTACHHCEDPACLSGCPVLAYEKDPVTGIVRHLDDQCIGCQYCLLKCPYDVPKYNAALGIVRKCDMCADRLAVGESPACVQGCPNGAISIVTVDRRRSADAAPELLPRMDGTIPDSAYTRPTTRYVSKRTARPVRPADLHHDRPAQAHDPLAVMLVLLELSVGTLLVGTATSALSSAGASLGAAIVTLAAVTAGLGLGAATLHLGRPLYGFRAILGWRTSWMSREILAFGAYTGAVGLAALLLVAAGLAPDSLPFRAEPVRAALLLGLVGTWCSMMIYADTHRAGWSLLRTAPTFAGTLLGLGTLGVGTLSIAAATFAPSGDAASPTGTFAMGLVVLGAKAVIELSIVTFGPAEGTSALARSVRLLRGPLRTVVGMRTALVGAGVVAGTIACLSPVSATGATLAAVALGTWVLAEIVERHLFFTAEASPGMPGV